MKKILIIHTAFIGDIVLSTAFIKKLKEKYKKSEISYLTTPAGGAVLKNNPFLKEIIIYDKKGKDKGLKGAFKVAKNLKEYKFDMAIIPHRYLKSSMIAYLAGIKERIGYANSEGRVLLTKQVEYQKDQHEVKRLLSLIDVKIKDINEAKLEMYPSKKEKENIDRIWIEKNLKKFKIVVLAPGSKWFTKMWPTEYFNELIKLLEKQEDIKVILIGGNDEKTLDLYQGKNTINLIAKTSLLDLAELLKRSDVLVTNDSSPIHIGVCFDIKVLAIFGATVKELGFYPWSKNSLLIENEELSCRPCGLHGGKSCPEKHFKCMKEIKAERVYEEVMKSFKGENN